jgi:OmpA-OmpF porin, OOP family
MHKRSLVALSLTTLASVVGINSAFAEQGLSITPGYGYYQFDNETNLNDKNAPSIGIEYHFNDHFQIGANYANSETEAAGSALKENIDWSYTRLDTTYNFSPLINRFTPYISAGAGEGRLDLNNTTDEETETLVNLGTGVRFLLDSGLSVVADLRGINSIDKEQSSTLTSVGLSYMFGSNETSNAKGGEFEITKTSDADQDGVADATDECQNTPTGVAVNQVGCGLDGDTDGIADYQDDCAQTPAGVVVDLKGCPLDNDRDGIADAQDQCPNTEAGNLIDKTGCDLNISANMKFKSGSAAVAAQLGDAANIKELASFLKQYENTIAIIEGHADATGSAAKNQSLAQARADNVKKILIEQFGISANRLETVSHGDTKPIASNDTQEGRQLNRRVTAKISQQ